MCVLAMTDRTESSRGVLLGSVPTCVSSLTYMSNVTEYDCRKLADFVELTNTLLLLKKYQLYHSA